MIKLTEKREKNKLREKEVKEEWWLRFIINIFFYQLLLFLKILPLNDDRVFYFSQICLLSVVDQIYIYIYLATLSYLNIQSVVWMLWNFFFFFFFFAISQFESLLVTWLSIFMNLVNLWNKLFTSQYSYVF